MTTAAIASGTTAAAGTGGAHPTAGSAFVTAAFEAENRHHPLHVGGTTSIATDCFITTKN
jgi:hypothetical protein